MSNFSGNGIMQTFGVSEPKPPPHQSGHVTEWLRGYMPAGSRVSMHLLESLNNSEGNSNGDVKKATV